MTVKKYFGAFWKWKRWAATYKLSPIPARLYEFVLYLQHMGEKTRSKSVVEEAHNALSWMQSCTGLIAHPLKATLAGLQHELAKPVVKKEPMMLEMLEVIVADTNGSGTLSDLRLATAYLLGYAGFFCFQEIVDLRACDYTIEGKMLKVYIASI